jgi:hypothetical protein
LVTSCTWPPDDSPKSAVWLLIATLIRRCFPPESELRRGRRAIRGEQRRVDDLVAIHVAGDIAAVELERVLVVHQSGNCA